MWKFLLLSLLFSIQGFSKSSHKKAKSPKELLPKGYVISYEKQGDLNKDGQEDYVYVIKGSDKNKIKNNVDFNRYGIVIIFKKKDQYELIVENKQCFFSDNEDGGVYFPPELSVDIKKGNIVIHVMTVLVSQWVNQLKSISTRAYKVQLS